MWHPGAMDTSQLEAAYAELIESGQAGAAVADNDAWDADTVLAHVVASNRMIAAASADLLDGRIPVVDNRATQSPYYLAAIVASAPTRSDLLAVVDRSAREVVTLATQLSPEQVAVSVPTIILDGGRIRVQRPAAFSTLLEPTHIRVHVDQLLGLRQ